MSLASDVLMLRAASPRSEKKFRLHDLDTCESAKVEMCATPACINRQLFPGFEGPEEAGSFSQMLVGNYVQSNVMARHE